LFPSSSSLFCFLNVKSKAVLQNGGKINNNHTHSRACLLKKAETEWSV
jgi:hypothetical protein